MIRLAKLAAWIVLIAVILFYPMFISIYVTLPLFIGYAGYQFIQGLEGKGWRYLFLPMLYLANLEINLSLPLFLTLAAALFVYLFLYPSFLFLKRCPLCVAILTVLFVDLVYLGMIMIYDFIFASQSIEINTLLLYSLGMDILAAVIL
ncbi:hypothetical protein [Nitratifractor sp.]